jgi:hypothetical protein
MNKKSATPYADLLIDHMEEIYWTMVMLAAAGELKKAQERRKERGKKTPRSEKK